MLRTRSRAESWRFPNLSRWTGYLSSRLILSSIPDSGGASCSTSSIRWATTSLKDLGNLSTTLPTLARLSQSFIFVTLPVHIRSSPAGASVSAGYHVVHYFIPRSTLLARSYQRDILWSTVSSLVLLPPAGLSSFIYFHSRFPAKPRTAV